MICSSSSPPIRRRPGEGHGPRGFTMVELLVVILILALLIALLLPAINGALRTAKNAAVGGEINQLAQALAAFKSQYGDYPPSRIYLAENGDYTVVNSNVPLPAGTAAGDITLGQLAQRSVAALRKFFPRVVLNTSGGPVFANNSLRWYDFNGNGVMDAPYILQGHECLVFFLGGIPVQTSTGLWGMTGFGKDPTNPFTNSIPTFPNGNPNPMYSNNRQAPLYEFVANRLVLDTSNPYTALAFPQIPGYLDSLGNSLGNNQINFYAYFSSYGNGGYDPNDVNFATLPDQEVDANNVVAGLLYHVAFAVLPVPGNIGCASPAPNPYTSTTTAQFNGTTSLPTTYLNPQSFQIISAGLDGLYGVGGQYSPDNVSESLPLDPILTNYLFTQDRSIRIRERDNITNFHNNKLE